MLRVHHAIKHRDRVALPGGIRPGGERSRAGDGSGAIHIEFPGGVLITAECGADRELLRSILESLRK
jgi:hypothetical protein